MTISPAAQAVLDAAFTLADLLNRDVSKAEMIAAALRAAADQANLKLQIEDISYQHQLYVDGWKDSLDLIIDIASELESQ